MHHGGRLILTCVFLTHFTQLGPLAVSSKKNAMRLSYRIRCISDKWDTIVSSVAAKLTTFREGLPRESGVLSPAIGMDKQQTHSKVGLDKHDSANALSK